MVDRDFLFNVEKKLKKPSKFSYDKSYDKTLESKIYWGNIV